jgi:hypothetical protein
VKEVRISLQICQQRSGAAAEVAVLRRSLLARCAHSICPCTSTACCLSSDLLSL